MPQKSVANCFCKAVCLSEGCATSCLGCFIAISRHVFYLSKTAIIFYLVLICRFTARFFSFQNYNYILFSIYLSFHATVFFCSKPHLFHWLFVLSRHGVFFLFKTTFISLDFCPFTARFFVSVQNCNYVPLTFCRFTARCFYLFKTAIIFYLVFVCRFTARCFCLFKNLCCSKQCKVQ